ncbi:hypothetical protein BGC07_00865 [Piscirickettsia litoralis]|uniref:Periplasmic binding protein domain-containing protein n=1 Tax=Piscirickettsia litoralis TaxID=1891921 RepID=A0ABX3A540_9GAMM|nr:hypothetical protein BGC07_00865 [Piscirickettsia litoralis]
MRESSLQSYIANWNYSAKKASCIGVVTAGGGQGFFGSELKGVQKRAGKELGVVVHTRGLADELNFKGQRSLINYFTQKLGCEGLLLAPNSNDRKEDVDRLKAQGVIVVYIDRDMAGDRVSVVKTENFRAGEIAGREMVAALKGQGNIAVLRLSKEVVSTTAREEGFIKAAKAGGLKIVVDEYVGTKASHARGKAYDIFNTHNDIDGVFTPNESSSIGTLKALERANKTGKILHIGFDSHPVMLKALRSGKMYGFIAQRPFQMGYQGVNIVHRVIQGKPVKPAVDTGVIFINMDNLNDKEVRNILKN